MPSPDSRFVGRHAPGVRRCNGSSASSCARIAPLEPNLHGDSVEYSFFRVPRFPFHGYCALSGNSGKRLQARSGCPHNIPHRAATRNPKAICGIQSKVFSARAIAVIQARNPKRTEPIRQVVRLWKVRCRADDGTIRNQRRIPLPSNGVWGVLGKCWIILSLTFRFAAPSPSIPRRLMQHYQLGRLYQTLGNTAAADQEFDVVEKLYQKSEDRVAKNMSLRIH